MATRLIARDYGGIDQLEIIDENVDAPGPGEVRIAVRAAALNPADLKTLAGEFGRRAEPPLRPGMELSGVVAEVGEGVENVAPGDEVIAFRVRGAFASEVVVPAGSVFAKPSALGWEQAAGLLLTGVTAWHLLEATGTHEGDRVLAHGVSGAVGVAVAQLARERGAEVLGTASPRNHALVERFGVTPVAWGDGLADRVRAVWPDGPTVALDMVGTDEALDVSVELVADRDRIATIAGFARGAGLGIRLLGGGPGADPGSELRDAARAKLVEIAARGGLEVVVAAGFSFGNAREAFELVGSGHPGGKVVLLP